MQRIHLLDPILANQIAAGEVVERPCAVVKELIENALDAHATHLDIVIERGGLGGIRITDNGLGIHADDLLLAISRHATSKIHCLDDLQSVVSLGFRGEALASIAAVSQFRLLSRTAEQKTAISLVMEGHLQSIAITPCAHPVGTTVEVRDLFFNTPARRHFLRAEKTEFAFILDVVQRIAMSRAMVSFTLTHNEKRVFSSNESAEQRLARFFGSAFIQKSHRIDKKMAGLHLYGWIGFPEVSRSQMDMQYFYLNGRVVRDKLIQHAIREAYAEQLYPGRHAIYALFLEVNVQTVDVNVHPTKQEVRFKEARLVHDFLVLALVEKLGVKALDVELSQFVSSAVARTGSYAAPTKELEKTTSIILTQLPKSNAVLIQRDARDVELLDLHAVFSCSIAQYLISDIQNNTLKIQPLLTPYSRKISPLEARHLLKKQAILQSLGILLLVEESQAIVQTIPALFSRIPVSQLMDHILLTQADDLNTLSAELACSAIPPADETVNESMLLMALQNVSTHCRCAHGRQAMVSLSPERIEQWITV